MTGYEVAVALLGLAVLVTVFGVGVVVGWRSARAEQQDQDRWSR